MNILLLAPQPFYQDRGTPIAVDLLLKVFAEQKHKVDLVTYAEGQNVDYEGVNIYRATRFPFYKGVKAGFSWKKLASDFFMTLIVLYLVIRKKYQVIWAVEEMVFLALIVKFIFKVPYVYDMDSSLAQQMVEQYPRLSFVQSMLEFFEGLAVRNAQLVVPVCDALANDIAKYDPNRVSILHDISLLDNEELPTVEDLRATLNLNNDLMFMYVGNLQSYQGIDLLLESFALALTQEQTAQLVIIGGAPQDIVKYKNLCQTLGIESRVHLLGPKPIEHLNAYTSQADVLLSPRTKGKNTPMKIYSYLHSGKALLATDLLTHTQLLTPKISKLAVPKPEPFAQAMIQLMRDSDLRDYLGKAAHRFIEEGYTFTAFSKKLAEILDGLELSLAKGPTARSIRLRSKDTITAGKKSIL